MLMNSGFCCVKNGVLTGGPIALCGNSFSQVLCGLMEPALCKNRRCDNEFSQVCFLYEKTCANH